MIIKPYRKYVVSCRGRDMKLYRWHLWIKPEHKAWKIVNQEIKAGELFKEHLILTVEDVTDTPYGETFPSLNLWKHSSDAAFTEFDDSPDGDDHIITEEEFKYALASSNVYFAGYTSRSQSYRCQICNGVVVNDICTDCCFDWDS